MELKKIENIINEIILNNKGINANLVISSQTKLRDDLGFDSLDLAELTVRIESEYGIDIFEDGIVNTVGEILEKLENRIGK